jgi:hypothetical protein
MRQTKILSQPRFSLVPRVFAGCCESLLEVGPSRRYLCKSFSTCLDPYPGCSCGARARYFPHDYGLPGVPNRSALGRIHTIATSVCGSYRGCSHSLMFKPADLLATLVAHTLVNSTRHLWLLRPDSSRFVTSPRPGYANRPIRAIDGMWTFTAQDSQPCRLFLRHDPYSAFSPNMLRVKI